MCVYDVLSTYTGPANLQAGWQANTIQLKWYNGDTQLSVQSAANNCTYDSGLTIPSTAPTKTGYTFAGWKIKAASESNACFVGPVCGLTSSLVATDGTAYGFRNDSTGEYGANSSNDTTYGLTSDQTWAVEFSHGIVRGTASCNNNPGGDLSVLDAQYEQIEAQLEAGTITEEEAEAQVMALDSQIFTLPGMCQPTGTFSSSSTGQYCWCHAESYTPTGGSSCNVSSLAWVFYTGYESADDCANSCAFNCASNVRIDSPFRAAVFGVAGN